MIKKLFLPALDTVTSLDSANIVNKTSVRHQDRSKVQIAVIDDKPFEPAVVLRNNGYNVTEIGDIKSIDEVAGFQIVLCDIMNVGMQFDPNDQGASIIREIRTNFPAIMVAAYSGNRANTQQSRLASQLADAYLKKDAVLRRWLEVLDGFSVDLSNPRTVWYRVRHSLVEKGIDTKQLLILEDAFVHSIKEKKADGIKKEVSNLGLESASKTIVLNLVSSAIFGIFTQ